MKNLCVYCNSELEEELFNSVYGCDTGCEYVKLDITCPNCHKIIWSTGDFGYIYQDDDSEEEYRERFMEEFAMWIEDYQKRYKKSIENYKKRNT